ncbi:MAG: thymidine kinase [Erysipelotrichaceae bacterium]
MEYKQGLIEVICGPMFAGKTEELIRRAIRLDYAKKKYIVFKPLMDNRYANDEIVSHSKYRKNSINIDKSEEIYNHLTDDIEVIFIDEVQFYDDTIVSVCEDLAKKGYRIIVGGLDCDFKGDPFMITALLLAKAETVVKLTAICNVCGNEATKTQRIINGKPAHINDEIILVGASEAYEPRCRKCHEILTDER